MTPPDVPDGPLVIDTDVFSWLLSARYRHEDFRRLIDGHQFVLAFATVGELRAGALSAGWGDKRREALEERISGCIVLPATDRVASLWATYHAKLRDQLGRSGGNDMWIAAAPLPSNRRSQSSRTTSTTTGAWPAWCPSRWSTPTCSRLA